MTKLSGLLYKPHRWLKEAFGRTKEGKILQSFDVTHATNIRTGEVEEQDPSKDVVAWSLYGGVVYCYDSDRRDIVLEKLRRAIREVTGRTDYIAQFNDRPETTFDDIARVLKIANV